MEVTDLCGTFSITLELFPHVLPLVFLFYTCGLSHLFFLVFGIYFCHNWYGIKSFIKKRKKCLELICFYSSWIPSLNYGRWMHFLFCLIWSSWPVISIEIGSSALLIILFLPLIPGKTFLVTFGIVLYFSFCFVAFFCCFSFLVYPN